MREAPRAMKERAQDLKLGKKNGIIASNLAEKKKLRIERGYTRAGKLRSGGREKAALSRFFYSDVVHERILNGSTLVQEIQKIDIEHFFDSIIDIVPEKCSIALVQI